ncbi:NAD(P)-binding protein [Rhizodiscina lignyota]|uniref:NAD(P)-binding protein n=1 Tax=Rhizodiscina lignyota TaxID=1504668 RepID=A0A9P4I5X0_9PEZI|nr:NAD(P)-binding protein [Rhizodiscina lignyota]
MSDYFQDKVIAISGGASGMGLEAAQLLSSKGAKVSIADVQEGRLEEVKKEIESSGCQCLVCVTDVRIEAQVQIWISNTISHFGRLDGVANLAAIVGKDVLMKATEDITTEDWNLVIGVNLTGMMNCLRAQIPHLKAGASIVVVSSISGQRGFEKNGAYCASKHGVIGLSRCTAKELGPKGIRLNIVAPGPIDTPLMRQTDDTRPDNQDMDFFSHLALKRVGKPLEVAELIEFLLSDKSSFITGAVINIDGGWV